MEEVLINGEADIVKGKFITQMDQMKEEFKISFDFMCGYTSEWYNMVHFTTQDANNNVDGSYVPCVWCSNGQLQVSFSVNGNVYYYHKFVNFAVNVWHSLIITQEKVDNNYVYSFTLDDMKVHEVINNQPKVYNNVKVYASDPWHPSSGGKIKNLKFYNGTKIDPALQCPHCLNMFNEPTLLDCCDTYCRGCVEELLNKYDNDTIECGVCKLTSVSNGNGALWTNEVVQRKLDMARGVRSKCEECETNPAKKYCLDCRCNFCVDCMTHHLFCAKSRDHRVDDIGKVAEQDLVSTPRNSKCATHKKVIEYYCERCKVAACLDCMHSRTHRGHRDEMALMEEVFQEELHSLKKMVADDSWNKYEEYLGDIEKFMKTAAKKREASRVIVDETFEEIISELQKKKSEVMRCLDEQYEAGMRALRSPRDMFMKAKARINYLAELTASPSAGSSENVVRAKVWVEGAREKVLAALQDQDVGDNIYRVDRALLTSREVLGLDDESLSFFNEMLNGAKNLSFKQNSCNLEGSDGSGTF